MWLGFVNYVRGSVKCSVSVKFCWICCIGNVVNVMLLTGMSVEVCLCCQVAVAKGSCC